VAINFCVYSDVCHIFNTLFEIQLTNIVVRETKVNTFVTKEQLVAIMKRDLELFQSYNAKGIVYVDSGLFLDKPGRQKKMVDFLSRTGSIVVALSRLLIYSPLYLELKFLVKIWCLLWRCTSREALLFLRQLVGRYLLSLDSGSFSLAAQKQKRTRSQQAATDLSATGSLSGSQVPEEEGEAPTVVFQNINTPKLRQIVHIVFNLLEIHGLQLLTTGLAVEKMHQQPKNLFNRHSNNLKRDHEPELSRLLMRNKLEYILGGGVWGPAWTTKASPEAISLVRRLSSDISVSSLFPFSNTQAVFQTACVRDAATTPDDPLYSSFCAFRHLLPLLKEAGIIVPDDNINSLSDYLADSVAPLFCRRVRKVEHRDRSFSFSFTLSEADIKCSLMQKHKLMFSATEAGQVNAFVLFVSCAYVFGRSFADGSTVESVFFCGHVRRLFLSNNTSFSVRFDDCARLHMSHFPHNQGACPFSFVPASAVICEGALMHACSRECAGSQCHPDGWFHFFTPDAYHTSMNWLGVRKQRLKSNLPVALQARSLICETFFSYLHRLVFLCLLIAGCF
jgi:hypothetical protein